MMQTAHNAAATISISLSLGALLYLAVLYERYRIDRARDDLFALRDDLFDYAVKNNLLDCGAYRQLRHIMNSMIRFSHKLTFTRLFIVLFCQLRGWLPKKSSVDDWRKSLEPLSVEYRGDLIAFHERMVWIVVIFMFERSLFFHTLKLGGQIYYRARRFAGRFGVSEWNSIVYDDGYPRGDDRGEI